MKAQTLSISRIRVPEWAERSSSRVEDDLLAKSIQQGGIQQPLVVLPDGKKFVLVDGVRRLRVAESLGIGKVPVAVDDAPKGEDAEQYARRIRFILDQHRQDLLPTQRAELIETLKATLKMNHRQIAAYLGIVPDSVTNWLAVKSYIEPVRQAMDAGRLTMQSARVFDGMSEDGQMKVWQRHGSDLVSNGAKMHKKLRKQYSPQAHPEYYKDADLVIARLKRVQGPRKAKARAQFSTDEKRRLMASVEMKEVELRESTDEITQLKREITAATPIVAAIMRNEKLIAHVPEEMREELERFAEVYV